MARLTVSADPPGNEGESAGSSGPTGSGSARPSEVSRSGSLDRGLSTVGSGKPYEAVDERQLNGAAPGVNGADGAGDAPVMDESEDIARQALTQAQRLTQASQTRSRRRRRRVRDASGGYSGAGPDDRDPQAVGGLLEGLVDERGWQRPLAEARVFADWPSLVGADNAAHCRPASLNQGELRITAESTAWATQLQLMAGALLASLARELGPDVVRKIFITGPTGPSWKHGGWSVRGARGPRDTYG
jgi:predicted nucleic acid-binding Zn ribbon protein